MSNTLNSMMLLSALPCVILLTVGASTISAQDLKTAGKEVDPFGSFLNKPAASRDSLRRDEIFEDLGGQGDVSAKAIANDLKAHPDSALAHVRQGDVNWIDGDYEQSEREFAQAVKIDPKCAKAHIGLGRTYIATQKFDKGFSELAKAQELGPPSTSMAALWESAFYLREMKRYPEALVKYNELLKNKLLTGRKRAWAMFHRAELYERTKRFQLSIDDLTQAIKIAPLTNEYGLRARAYAQMKKYNEALADYATAINRKNTIANGNTSGTLSSTLAKLYRERAMVYQQMGDRKAAQRDVDAAHATERGTMEVVPFRSDNK